MGLGLLLVLLDFGLQANVLLTEVGWGALPGHYLLVLSKRAPLLIAIASLLAVVLVGHQLVKQHEWVALLSAGIPPKATGRPFLLFATLCSGLLLANAQWLQPQAIDRLDALENLGGLRMTTLREGSRLLCKKATQEVLEDVWWISEDRIAHAEQVHLLTHTVDHGQGWQVQQRRWERHDEALRAFISETPAKIQWQSASWAESQKLSRLWAVTMERVHPKMATLAVQRVLLSLLPLILTLWLLPSLLRYQRGAALLRPMLLALLGVFFCTALWESLSLLTGLDLLSVWWGLSFPGLLLGGLGVVQFLRWQTD